MTCTIPLGIGQQAQLPQQGPGQRTGTKKVLGHNAGVGGGQSSDAVAQVGYKLQTSTKTHSMGTMDQNKENKG